MKQWRVFFFGILLTLSITTAWATTSGGAGNDFVRSHPFSIKASNIHSAMFDASEYAAANLTALSAFAETTPQIQAAATAGIPWVAHMQVNADTDDDWNWFKKLVNDVKDEKGCEGWIIYDEPGYLEMSRAKSEADWVRSVSPDTLVYAVALPSWASAELLYGDTSNPTYSWDTYLSDFLSIIQPDVLEYDSYPFMEDGTTKDDFFHDLMGIRAKGIAEGIPYFAYIQSWAYLPTWRVPSESDIRMQIFSYLAAGYSSISYFTYDYNQDGGLLNASGNPSPLYYIAQGVNPEVSHLGTALRFLTSTDVRYTPGASSPGVLNPIPDGITQWQASAGGDPHITNFFIDASLSTNRGSEKNGLIGFFADDGGQHYFMIVNLSHAANKNASEETLPFAVTFDDSVNSILELDRETGETKTVSLTNHQLIISLLGGSGKLYKYNNGSFPTDPKLNILSVDSQDITKTSATIHFVFDQKAQGQIEYGTTTTYDTWSVKETSFNFSNHMQTLTTLLQGTTYHYRIHGWDTKGNEAVSEDYHFTTLGSAVTTDYDEINDNDIDDYIASDTDTPDEENVAPEYEQDVNDNDISETVDEDIDEIIDNETVIDDNTSVDETVDADVGDDITVDSDTIELDESEGCSCLFIR